MAYVLYVCPDGGVKCMSLLMLLFYVMLTSDLAAISMVQTFFSFLVLP